MRGFLRNGAFFGRMAQAVFAKGFKCNRGPTAAAPCHERGSSGMHPLQPRSMARFVWASSNYLRHFGMTYMGRHISIWWDLENALLREAYRSQPSSCFHRTSHQMNNHEPHKIEKNHGNNSNKKQQQHLEYTILHKKEKQWPTSSNSSCQGSRECCQVNKSNNNRALFQ